MKNLTVHVMVLCVLVLSAGCHSGTTRGIGSDISKLGSKMQK